jgi:hypothetical protein
MRTSDIQQHGDAVQKGLVIPDHVVVSQFGSYAPSTVPLLFRGKDDHSHNKFGNCSDSLADPMK